MPERPVRPARVIRAPLLLCAALALTAPAARAAVACTAAATGVAFGIYTPLQTSALEANGTITITCTGVLFDTATVSLSPGMSGTYTTRSLTSSTSILNYNLYTSSADSAVWGNGSGSSSTVQALIWFFAPTATLTVYGAVASGQDPAPGTYTDTIMVTVSY
jgi:spore coat protein U-like protein